MTRSPQELQTGKAIGKIPSGLYILALAHGPVQAGALVSWVQQAAFAPLSVSVALGRGRSIADLIRQAGQFTLSILGQSDMGLMKHFARGIQPGPDALGNVQLGSAPSGQPYLAEAMAWIDCRLTQVVEFGADHELLLAAVTAGQVLKEGPSFTHLRGSGHHY